MKKLLFILAICATLSLSASPIGAERAREIAEKFLSAGATRSAVAVEMAWAGVDVETIGSATRSSMSADDATLYIYNRADKGGFVIVSGDDNVEQMIIAYSHEESLDCSDLPDAIKDILQAWSDQIADARLAPRISTTTRSDNQDTGEVEVAYETARWGQNYPFHRKTPSINGKQCATGCVATAMAIFCHYHRWPKSCPHTFAAYTSNDQSMPEVTFGEEYRYDKMLLAYKSGQYNTEQADAVAHLMWECGRAVEMQYGTGSSSGSLSTGTKRLMSYFGYSKEGLYRSKGNTTDKEWQAMLKENLKLYGPTLMRGITASGGGHAFVLDGATSKNYFRINYGWVNSAPSWYLLPNITYCKSQSVAFYMKPDKDGSSVYRDFIQLRSRVDSSGTDINGIYASVANFKSGEAFTVKAVLDEEGYDSSGFDGKIRLAHCDKENKIKKILKEESCTLNNSEVKIVAFTDVTLTEPIEDGDRLRVLYGSKKLKDANGNIVWSMCTGTNDYSTNSRDGAYGELLLRLSAEDCADSLTLEYTKQDKTLLFLSRHTIQYSITNSSGKVVQSDEVAPLTQIKVDFSNHPSDTYTFSFASSGEPHIFTIKL